MLKTSNVVALNTVFVGHDLNENLEKTREPTLRIVTETFEPDDSYEEVTVEELVFVDDKAEMPEEPFLLTREKKNFPPIELDKMENINFPNMALKQVIEL